MGLNLGVCEVCRQRSELTTTTDGTNRAVCNECKEVIEKGFTKKQNHHQEPPVSQPSDVNERQQCLSTIFEKADEAWLKKFISETVSKKVLKYDWQTVIQNPRWFSPLDLRRYALELDPEFDKPNSKPNEGDQDG